MTKEEALDLIDSHKNNLVHPVELLKWTYLRVYINAISPDEWEEIASRSLEVLSK